MAEQPAGERTEAPTPKRLADAARDGDILASRELATALVVVGGCLALIAFGPWLTQQLQSMLTDALTFDASDIIDFSPSTVAWRLTGLIAPPVMLILCIAALSTVASPSLLGSLRLRGSALQFKASRINPMAGAARMFGKQSLNELVKALAKSALIGAVGVWLVWRQIDTLASIRTLEASPHMATLGGEMTLAMVALCVCFLLIALIDVPAQYLMRMGRLRMTRQQVQDEHKQSEGSPELRAQIRQRQREVLSRSARSAVREATVILVNPTHFSVALRYTAGRDTAPVIVARGKGASAHAIRELAGEAGVAVVRHAALTRAIYFTGREGQTVREDLFMAVATVLAFVQQVDAAHRDRDMDPVIPVPAAARYDADGRLAD